MKQQRTMLFGTIAFVVILIAGASSSLANSNQTIECGNCHVTVVNLSLSSNATGTVAATAGVPFVLEIDASDPDVTDLGPPPNIAVKVVDAWQDNAQFSYSISLVEDGDATDSNANTGVISFDLTVTPLAQGSWTIRIWAASEGLDGMSIDISVNVAASTVTTTTTGTTTGTTTTTTTTTTNGGPGPEELVAIWETMMITFIPAAGILLVLLGIMVIRRSSPNR